MKGPDTSIARVTSDGWVTRVGTAQMTSPRFGTDAYGVEMFLPLTDDERKLFAWVLASDGGRILQHARSAFGQLGVDAFDPDVTSVLLATDGVTLDTQITSLSGERGERVIAVLRQLAGAGQRPAFGRMSILPHQARLQRSEVVDAMAAGDVHARFAQVDEMGFLALPLQGVRYEYADAAYDPQLLHPVLRGRASARASIFRHRIVTPSLPATLPAGAFFVGGIDLHVRSHHVVLDPDVRDERGASTGTVHLSPLFLDAGRTMEGDRQVELRANGRAVDLRRALLHAALYRAAEPQEPGV